MNKHKLTFSVYRKPISTETIIHHGFCHPYEHKGDELLNRTKRWRIICKSKKKKKKKRNYTILSKIRYQQVIKTKPYARKSTKGTNNWPLLPVTSKRQQQTENSLGTLILE
jgi:hypothetical protein